MQNLCRLLQNPRPTLSRRDSPGGEPPALSIGALSAATGIPIDTIRTWERRYGYPVAARKLSGHRVYPLATVPRLRRIAEAIARGHRAAEVVPASEKALDQLLASLPAVIRAEPQSKVAQPSFRAVKAATTGDLMDAVRRFDAEELKRSLSFDWARLSATDFLQGRVAPFLAAVGNAWADGSLEVRHEHFASAVVGDFLRSLRGPLDERATGPVVALTTLPGELHGLGLQMSALIFVLAGWSPLVLGVNSPVEQIAALAREVPVAAIALSCVQPLHRKDKDQIAALRKRVPRRIPIIVGGEGAASAGTVEGTEVVSDLQSLARWLDARQSAR